MLGRGVEQIQTKEKWYLAWLWLYNSEAPMHAHHARSLHPARRRSFPTCMPHFFISPSHLTCHCYTTPTPKDRPDDDAFGQTPPSADCGVRKNQYRKGAAKLRRPNEKAKEEEGQTASLRGSIL